jgi:hypothetical protein
MATVTRTYLVDDLDGSEAAETVQLSLDKQTYEIDLSAANSERLRENLARFVDAATPSKGSRAVSAKRGRKANVSSTNKRDVQAIRDWAAKAGLQVSARGRIATTVQDAYDAR